MKLWIINLTIQIPSLNYNNTYTQDSKYWNMLLLWFSLFNQNQSFKDNSNSIKPNTYIHMNVNNSKNKNTISLIYVNIKSDKKTLHTFLFWRRSKNQNQNKRLYSKVVLEE